MRTLVPSAAVACLLLSAPGYAEDAKSGDVRTGVALLSGGKLYENCKSSDEGARAFYAGYIVGAADTMNHVSKWRPELGKMAPVYGADVDSAKLIASVMHVIEAAKKGAIPKWDLDRLATDFVMMGFLQFNNENATRKCS